jgi:NitT/TauT family transport system permease protein
MKPRPVDPLAWERVETVILPLAFGALLYAVWYGMVRATGSKVFPLPRAVAAGIGELARKGLLLPYVAASLLRVAGGFTLGALVGVPTGLLMGWYPRLSESLNPVIQVLRPISPLAWIPVAIVLFGVTDGAAVFLVFLASVFPITVSAMNAVRSVPEIFVRAALNFGLSRRRLFLRVVLPATLPRLLLGLRLTLGVAWLVVVAAEMIAVDSGLGYLIVDARNAGKRYDLVMSGMLLIGIVGLLLDAGFRLLERRRSLSWGDRTD